nr:MAG TPA: hypothetical protein [Caudoviricetes sp.]
MPPSARSSCAECPAASWAGCSWATTNRCSTLWTER